MEGRTITIDPFAAEYASHFGLLNEQSLTKYFTIEHHNVGVLSEPVHHIIAPGGKIFFPGLDGNVVGTCALVKGDAGTFDLAKMVVTESAQALGIDKRPTVNVIECARARDAKSISPETNSTLFPALNLYRHVEAERPFQTV